MLLLMLLELLRARLRPFSDARLRRVQKINATIQAPTIFLHVPVHTRASKLKITVLHQRAIGNHQCSAASHRRPAVGGPAAAGKA